MTLDEALSERQRINAELQAHMASATEKWGVRLNRIEIVDIVPPQNIVDAMALQKEADQQKRAAILQSEGQQQAAINTAQGQKQANVLRAEGEKQSVILAAEGEKQSVVLRAEGNKEAEVRIGEGHAGAIAAVYAAIHQGNPTLSCWPSSNSTDSRRSPPARTPSWWYRWRRPGFSERLRLCARYSVLCPKPVRRE